MMPHSPYKYHGDAYGQDFQYKMACVNTDRLASKNGRINISARTTDCRDESEAQRGSSWRDSTGVQHNDPPHYFLYIRRRDPSSGLQAG